MQGYEFSRFMHDENPAKNYAEVFLSPKYLPIVRQKLSCRRDTARCFVLLNISLCLYLVSEISSVK